MERINCRHQEKEPMRLFTVIKFGGSSLADAESIDLCINAVRSGNYRAVVVSAPGKTTDLLQKVLDNQEILNDDSELLEIYRRFEKELNLPEPSLIKYCINELRYRLRSSGRDSVMAWGEWSMAQIFAAKLSGAFVDSAEVLRIVEDNKGIRRIDESSVNLVNNKFENAANVLVFSGYYGRSLKDNKIMTLNKGGSDYVGVYIASCIRSGLVKSTVHSQWKFTTKDNYET